MAHSKISPQKKEAALNALLTTSPPRVSLHDAQHVAAVCYPGFTECAALSGERDVNFRIAHKDGRALTLKFINAAEDVNETHMQVSVLKHLQQTRQLGVNAPRHQAAIDAALASEQGMKRGTYKKQPTLDWIRYRPAHDHTSVRVRAYSYLEGASGSQLLANPQAWHALGRVVARLGIQLAQFDHPAAHRELLWDTSQVLGIRPMLDALDDHTERRMIEKFLNIFDRKVAPSLADLPHQIIHNDLSPSNLLVDSEGLRPVGILDFGDMVYAPRIAEIAVAASYQMPRCATPMNVLDALVTGYQSEEVLLADERFHIMDLVLARLAQRMVITSWRAVRFPANRHYILRSHDEAKALFIPLYEEWLRSRNLNKSGTHNNIRVADEV